jgi:hypothetical protein
VKVMRITKAACATFGTMDLYLAFPEDVIETNGKADEYVLKTEYEKINDELLDSKAKIEGLKEEIRCLKLPKLR